MKKYFSVILALTLASALAVPAFAADVAPEGSANQEVTAGYTAPVDNAGDTVYRVTIEWNATDEAEALSYTGKKSTYTWDTTGLVYQETVDTAAGWSGAAGYNVTVTNYSNAAVDAALTSTNTYGLTLDKPAEETKELGSAAVDENGDIAFTETDRTGTKQEAAFTYTYKANSSATAPDLTEDGTIPVGKITVSIAGK